MRRLLPLLLVVASCHGTAPVPARPKSIILLIGDGMGIPQVTLGRFAKGGPEARLALDDLPVTGLVTVHAHDQWVTDSAAAATAMASGVKTYNEGVGVDPERKPVRALGEIARDAGWAVGLVTTSRITHATPAAFAAHIVHRDMEDDVAKQYLDSGVDVLLGGGARHFPAELRDAFRGKGYDVVTKRAELEASSSRRVLGLFGGSHVNYVLDRGPSDPSLPDMTRKALELLGDRPFFLMIEGARIDHAGHVSDAVSLAREMIEFDETVGLAAAWAKRRGDVLVLVTADHATGGMAITEKAMVRWPAAAGVRASVEAMTIETVAAGGSAEAMKDVLARRADIRDVTPAEADAFALAKGIYDPQVRIGEIVSRRVGVTFVPFEYRSLAPDDTHGHDGAMVAIYAQGPGAERFGGTLDNTQIFHRLKALAGW